MEAQIDFFLYIKLSHFNSFSLHSNKEEMGISRFKIAVYADGGKQRRDAESLSREVFAKGFTTNPTLMAKAGISDYTELCKDVLKNSIFRSHFEVFSDDFEEMKKQAEIISFRATTCSLKFLLRTQRVNLRLT